MVSSLMLEARAASMLRALSARVASGSESPRSREVWGPTLYQPEGGRSVETSGLVAPCMMFHTKQSENHCLAQYASQSHIREGWEVSRFMYRVRASDGRYMGHLCSHCARGAQQVMSHHEPTPFSLEYMGDVHAAHLDRLRADLMWAQGRQGREGARIVDDLRIRIDRFERYMQQSFDMTPLTEEEFARWLGNLKKRKDIDAGAREVDHTPAPPKEIEVAPLVPEVLPPDSEELGPYERLLAS